MIHCRAISHLGYSRLLQFFREPTAVFWVFGFPLGMLIVLGITFTDRPPETLQVDLLQPVESPFARRCWDRLRDSLKQDERIVFSGPSENSLMRLRRVGSSLIVKQKEETLTGKSPVFELFYDPDRPDSVHARDIVSMYIARQGVASPEVIWSEVNSPGKRYVDFLVPGLLAVNAMGASLVWFGFGLAEMRMLRLLRVLLTTPLTRLDLLLGLLVARWVLLVPETMLLLLVAYGLFGVVSAGSWLSLGVVQLCGATTFSAIGLLIGARGNRLESASGWLSVLMLGQWVFCGVFFARSVFPPAWQGWISWLPLSPYVDAARAIMLDGNGIWEVVPPLGVLSGWTLLAGAIGIWIFRTE